MYGMYGNGSVMGNPNPNIKDQKDSYDNHTVVVVTRNHYYVVVPLSLGMHQGEECSTLHWERPRP